jgi:hypothetical protein
MNRMRGEKAGRWIEEIRRIRSGDLEEGESKGFFAEVRRFMNGQNWGGDRGEKVPKERWKEQSRTRLESFEMGEWDRWKTWSGGEENNFFGVTKEHWGREDYLDWKDKRKVSVLASFRFGVVRLKGNKVGQEEEDTLCRACGDGVEDERHLMMECEEFHEERIEVVETCIGLRGEDWMGGWAPGKGRETGDGGVKAMCWLLAGGRRKEKQHKIWKLVVWFLERILRRLAAKGAEKLVGADEGIEMGVDEAVEVIREMEEEAARWGKGMEGEEE